MNNSKRKVLYVFGGQKASGAEIVIKRLIDANQELVEAHLFISPGDYATTLTNDGFPNLTIIKELKKLNRGQTNVIKTFYLLIKNYFILTIKALKYIKKNNIDIVHANVLGPAGYLIPAIVISRLLTPRVKWIWSDHDLRYHNKTDVKFAAICTAIYNLTLAVSASVANKYGNNNKVKVLYNGLDLNHYKPVYDLRDNFRNKYLISSDTIVIGIAGFIDKRKGQLELANVVKSLKDKQYNIVLVIAGQPLNDKSLYSSQLFEVIKNQPFIKHLGQVKDMSTFYNGCDIIINNSSSDGSEPLGTTIYEAMAVEKVAIAANTGGTPEIIEHNINGLLFDPENYIELKQQLVIAIESLSQLSSLRQNAREKVKQKFNILTMTEKYNEILNSL